MYYIAFASYFGIRLFSYFFPPETSLFIAHPFNQIGTAVILFLVIFLLLRKDIRGWYIIVAEIMLGGGGGFFALHGISLRSLLLLVSVPIFLLQEFRSNYLKKIWQEDRQHILILGSLFALGPIFAAVGFFHHHNLHLILADLIPYFFCWYYLPLQKVWDNENFCRFASTLLYVSILGNMLLAFITTIGFSEHWWVLQGNYYHWFRDVALGKITQLDPFFYRVVLNEQLLLIPTLIFCLHRKIKLTHKITLVGALLLSLGINFSRIYFLALLIALLLSFLHNDWMTTLRRFLVVIAAFILLFSATHLLVSHGQSAGWDLFSSRVQSITNPEAENSSLSRLLLLPPIWEKIHTNPLGEGLGATITVYNPILRKEIATPQFDWGYLELIVETGIIGFCIWVGAYFYIIRKTILSATKKTELIALSSFIIINITFPAFFHVFGILFLIACFCQINARADS